MKVSSTRRYLCHGFCSTTACNRQSSQYRRVDDTCNAASSVLLCSLRFQATGYRQGDDTRVPVSSCGSYVHVREFIIVVARIPLALSLHYLRQPVPLVSSPRRYHRHLLVSAGPYGDCDHMKVKNSIFRMIVEFIVSRYRFLKCTVRGNSALCTTDPLLSHCRDKTMRPMSLASLLHPAPPSAISCQHPRTHTISQA